MNTDDKTAKIQDIESRLLSQIAKLCQEAEQELKAAKGG